MVAMVAFILKPVNFGLSRSTVSKEFHTSPVRSHEGCMSRNEKVRQRRCLQLRAVSSSDPGLKTESDQAASNLGSSTPSSLSSSSEVDGDGSGDVSRCDACGRADGPINGCDGTGRVIGGLGAVVDWWPIKAYRPCPELAKAKRQYKRSGQSLDEIAFGRVSTSDKNSNI
jgi:hypothetical protein